MSTGHRVCEEQQRKAAGVLEAWHPGNTIAGDVWLAASDSLRPILRAQYRPGTALDPREIQTQTNRQLFLKACVVTSWMRKLYFSTLDQVLEISPDDPKTESESYKPWLEEGDCIFITGCTRWSFNSDFEFYLSILIIYASSLEIPNWFSPMEIWGGYNNTEEINSGTANHRMILIYKSLEARGTYCSLQAKKGLHHE